MTFSDILGQERAVKKLRSLSVSRKIPPALLFSGPDGVGKARAATALAAALNCEAGGEDSCGICPSCGSMERGADPDFQRIDPVYQALLREEEAAKQRRIRIDTIRHAVGAFEMKSLSGRWKVALIENAHLLMEEAANALLKALEEPPPRSLWILSTHRPGDLLPTVRSRCQTTQFLPLPKEILVGILKSGGTEPEKAARAAAMADGSAAKAIELASSEIENPRDWLSDPMGPFHLSESLPKELHLSRSLAESHLRAIAWFIRDNQGTDGYRSAAVRSVLQEIFDLRRALESNADPRLVTELAGLRLQQLAAAGRLNS